MLPSWTWHVATPHTAVATVRAGHHVCGRFACKLMKFPDYNQENSQDSPVNMRVPTAGHYTRIYGEDAVIQLAFEMYRCNKYAWNNCVIVLQSSKFNETIAIYL